jgi:hypothetical protein
LVVTVTSEVGFPEPINVTTFVQGVINDHSPWLTTDLVAYLSALASMFEPAYDVVVEQGDPDDAVTYLPGWSTLLDPTRCPTDFLPYLGQFVGAQVQPGTPDAIARNQITSLAAEGRGTPAAIVAAAKTALINTQTVFLLERQTALGAADAYHAVLLFFKSELATTQQTLVTAVEAVKPAGIQITYQSITGFTWDLAINPWSADTFPWQDASSTQP